VIQPAHATPRPKFRQQKPDNCRRRRSTLFRSSSELYLVVMMARLKLFTGEPRK
jgi:hypothetical protein